MIFDKILTVAAIIAALSIPVMFLATTSDVEIDEEMVASLTVASAQMTGKIVVQ